MRGFLADEQGAIGDAADLRDAGEHCVEAGEFGGQRVVDAVGEVLLRRRIADLERQLALRQQNSTTTSKPPSSDGLAGRQRERVRDGDGQDP